MGMDYILREKKYIYFFLPHHHLVSEQHPSLFFTKRVLGLGCGLSIVIHPLCFYYTLGHYPGHVVQARFNF